VSRGLEGCEIMNKVLILFYLSYSLMGASGCGKTTLISSLIGTLELDSGEIAIFDEEPRKNKLRIGYMPQDTALVETFSVREVLWFYGTIYGLSSDMINEQINFLSKLLELPRDERFTRECSGGEQRRVSFAVSLIHDPELLILDEPTVGLDPLLRAKLWDHLLDLTQKKNVTVLLSTHYTEEAKQSTHVVLMRNGVLVAENTPKNILTSTGMSHLDDAFFALSNFQESSIGKSSSMKSYWESPEKISPEKHLAHRHLSKLSNNKPKPLKALLKRSFLEVLRNFE
jgi:ABC-type multidrug transport system ATPase subunit